MADIRHATRWDNLLVLFRLRRRFVVEGESMLPSLKSGDTVIVVPSSKVKLGDIVAAAHPFKQSVTVIKRVESIDSNSRFVLIGDNPEASTDSRTFGSVPAKDIFGKVVARQFPQ